MKVCRTSNFFQWLATSVVACAVMACDRAPAEPSPPTPAEEPVATSEANEGASEASSTTQPNSTTEPSSEPESTGACLHPLPELAPPRVESLDECPTDPNPTPSMPLGTVTFPEASRAPRLRVELALNLEDQRHGLMFRPTLDDDEGMLFTYSDEAQRHFWMHNTCLALDMLHIDEEGVIVGIVENVPPWNDTTRTVPCPAQHVLEVRAGWSRHYGVEPGQVVHIDPTSE